MDYLELPDHKWHQEYILHHQNGKKSSLLLAGPQPEYKQLSSQHLNFQNHRDRTIFSYKAIL